MNDLKLNIYRYFPQLAAKEIESLITEYMSARNDFFDENKELTRLEKILPEVATNTFLNFAFSRGLRIDFERLVPKIQNNQSIVDFYIKKDPKVAFYVPEEMLTAEHVKIVEKYAVENKDTIRANGIIPKILRTDIIFEVVLNL